jgi:hypothetical protein
MIIGSVALASGHAIGGGTLACSGLAPILLAMDTIPTRVTVFSRATYNTPQQKQTTFAVVWIGGSLIGLGGPLVGSDQAFAAGDYVWLQAARVDIAPEVVVPPGTTGTITLDLSLGAIFAPAALTGTTTFNLANPGFRPAFTLEIIPGGQTISYGFSPLWPGGTAPTYTSTAGKKDRFMFSNDGDGLGWYGYIAGQDS